MTVKIDTKIVNASVVKEVSEEPIEAPVATAAITLPKKKAKRPDLLEGFTAKVSTPDCNIYVTVNHDEDYRPLEIFFSSSHLESLEWVALATRLASAILRTADEEVANLSFIAKEFMKTESPGKYLARILDQKKGQMTNGVIAHLGKTLLAIEKRLKAKAKLVKVVTTTVEEDTPNQDSTQLESTGIARGDNCPECFADSWRMMDNCPTCTECGYSKCG